MFPPFALRNRTVHPKRILALPGTCLAFMMLGACVAPPTIPGATLTTQPSHAGIRAVIRPGNPPQLQIHDSRGIGAVDVTFAEVLPSGLVVQLHLVALEQLELQADDLTINIQGTRGGAVAGDATVRQSGDVAPAHQDDPRMPVLAAYDRDGNPTTSVPLDGGYFEVTLPPALVEHAPGALTISWIDFYR